MLCIFLMQIGHPVTHLFFCSTIYTDPVMIDLVDYAKLVGFQTILNLAEENLIDTVYVRFAYENKDRMFDCMKPTDMLNLKDIIAERSPRVIGWRLHHHRWEDKNLALANAMMKSNPVDKNLNSANASMKSNGEN